MNLVCNGVDCYWLLSYSIIIVSIAINHTKVQATTYKNKTLRVGSTFKYRLETNITLSSFRHAKDMDPRIPEPKGPLSKSLNWETFKVMSRKIKKMHCINSLISLDWPLINNKLTCFPHLYLSKMIFISLPNKYLMNIRDSNFGSKEHWLFVGLYRPFFKLSTLCFIFDSIR